MVEIIEFYIASNPPLLPQGVSEVIRRVQDAEGLLEILYEPHVPWFRCVSLPGYQRHITTAVQDNLFAIADEDVDTLDIENQGNGDSEYVGRGSKAYTFADGDIFPADVAETKFKTAWRRLEEQPGATLQDLLDRVSQTIEEFESLTKCTILYNSRQTAVYIGSNESPDLVNWTIDRLDDMMDHYDVLSNLRSIREALPAAVTEPVPVSRDPLDDIPARVNASLPDSVAPWADPFKNEESLI
ncbi:hypothetical protein CCM_02291 [Cordyceps militaris CM01]|uniref:Uncharacterized protein n=1 Tax=Cordyceps militaris (strain CM01) TaxID=983644 RepID=G3J8Y8_CORMM|nr:uncharacterized protein CCM_02291 [Cordyceps militaris CM01]EGX94020.1 hypothetical protein CCM_02291 [Cordyceps militaris CM01]